MSSRAVDAPRHALGKNNSRISGFRTHYTNAFGIQFNGNELIAYFGILHDIGNPADGFEEQTALAMSPSNMKALALTLSKIVDQYELLNSPIPLSPEFYEFIAHMDASPPKKAE